jgi:hypothetical protein
VQTAIVGSGRVGLRIAQNVLVSDPEDRLFTGRLRVMQYVSDACIVFACAVFAVVVGKHWDWSPFLLAAGLVAVGAGANALLVHAASKRFRLNEEQRRRAAARRRTRNTVVVPSYITFGVGFGLIAGSIPSYWADLAMGVFMLGVTVLLPLAMLPAIRRRVAAHQSSGPSEAAEVPILGGCGRHQQYLATNPNGYCGIGATGLSCPVGVAKTVD